MVKTRRIPPGARRLRTYTELESYLADFAVGRYNFLWVLGRPGVGKTMSIRAALRGTSHLLRKGGQLTPLQLHIDLYAHRGVPVILDDAEHILDNKVGAKMIAALGDSTPAKLMSYGSTTRLLGDTPQNFWTTSRLCILANKSTTHEDIRSRAITLYFDPSSLEIHRAAARWFYDQEIHDWFGQHLHRLPPIDSRWYGESFEDKRADRDWKQIILSAHTQTRAEITVQDLETETAYPTRADKARRYGELMGQVPNNKDGSKDDGDGGSRPTYHRILKRLREQDRLLPDTVGRIQLARNRPPSTPTIAECDDMAAAPPPPPEPEPTQLDVPLRDSFAQPVRGDDTRRTPAPPAPLDDNVSWEGRPTPDQDDGEE